VRNNVDYKSEMDRENMTENKSHFKIGLITIMFLLFVFIMSWTVNFTFFTLDDIRLLAILLSCTGILVLIGQLDIDGLRDRIRFNLFLTAMVMSVLLIFNIFTEQASIFTFRRLIINAFKPLLLAIIAYLPILNVLEKLEHNHYLRTKLNNEAKDHGDSVSYPNLTRREREVFDLALIDLSNKEIAKQLYIAETTVKKHMQNIFKKIECSNREELIEKYSGLLKQD